MLAVAQPLKGGEGGGVTPPAPRTGTIGSKEGWRQWGRWEQDPPSLHPIVCWELPVGLELCPCAGVDWGPSRAGWGGLMGPSPMGPPMLEWLQMS